MENNLNKEVKIEYAVMEDIPEIMHIMDVVLSLVPDKAWFAVDDEAFMRNHIEKQGFTLKAVVDGKLAGFLAVRYPKSDADNLGEYLGLSAEEKQFVAHMESAAVLPEYRGLRIQNRLMEKGFELLQGTQYKYVMGTAHPENKFSVNNFIKLGYEVVAEVEKYGGLRRYVWSKTV